MHETVKVYSRYDKRTEAKHRCKAMVQNVREHGLPCHVSFTAGTYVCNCVMYNVLHLCATKYPNIRAGFIHVPFACEQVVGKASTMASMPLETIAKSLEYCIEAVVTNKEEVKEAMRQAIANLSIKPELLLNDAVMIPGVDIKQVPIIKGDAKSISIGAASIMAKVYRDHMMEEYDKVFPEYGFASNKGYGSADHIAALKKYGETLIHRKTFITHFI